MKRKIILLIAILVLLLVSLFGIKYIKSKNETDLKSRLGLSSGAQILIETDGDTDNDLIPEKILVYAKKMSANGLVAENINVALVESKTGFIKKTNLPEINGYNPQIYLYDFTGDKKNDVLLTIHTDEESTSTQNILLDFSSSIPTNVFPVKNSKGLFYSLKLIDNFCIEAISFEGLPFAINISKNAEHLINSGIYDSYGMLLDNPPQVILHPFFSALPTDTDGDSIYELICHQKICLAKDDYELCNMLSIHSFQGKQWKVLKTEFAHTVIDMGNN